MRKENGVLLKVTNDDIKLLETNPEEFWRNVIKIESRAFDNCIGLTSITIPSSVTEIEWRAFSGCIGLTSITIPDSVTKIEGGAFSGCTGLTEIKVDAGNKYFSSEDGALYNKDKTKILHCPESKTSITIPDTVTEIEAFAFYGCTGLTSITIPDSVTKIGASAFYGCNRTIAAYKNFRLLAKFLNNNTNFDKLKNITDEKEKRIAQECFSNNLDYLSFSDREKVGNNDLNW